MKTLIIINDAPYGTERAYNALRIINWVDKQMFSLHKNPAILEPHHFGLILSKK